MAKKMKAPETVLSTANQEYEDLKIEMNDLDEDYEEDVAELISNYIDGDINDEEFNKYKEYLDNYREEQKKKIEEERKSRIPWGNIFLTTGLIASLGYTSVRNKKDFENNLNQDLKNIDKELLAQQRILNDIQRDINGYDRNIAEYNAKIRRLNPRKKQDLKLINNYRDQIAKIENKKNNKRNELKDYQNNIDNYRNIISSARANDFTKLAQYKEKQRSKSYSRAGQKSPITNAMSKIVSAPLTIKQYFAKTQSKKIVSKTQTNTVMTIGKLFKVINVSNAITNNNKIKGVNLNASVFGYVDEQIKEVQKALEVVKTNTTSTTIESAYDYFKRVTGDGGYGNREKWYKFLSLEAVYGTFSGTADQNAALINFMKIKVDMTEDFILKLKSSSKEMQDDYHIADWALGAWIPDQSAKDYLKGIFDKIPEDVDKIPDTIMSELETKPLKFKYFKSKVGDRCDWDYKNKAYKSFDIGLILSDKLYVKDVPGNIAYGFTGAAAGFSADILKIMAGLNQKNKGNSVSEWTWELSYFDDPRDQAAIQAGVDLWNKYGKDVDAAKLKEFINMLN